MVCPWNKFAKLSAEPDFRARHALDAAALVDLFSWSETEFLQRTEGSAIRRIGHERWLRNIAVALGNAPRNADVLDALNARAAHESAVVREHVAWALTQHQIKAGNESR
jgi:epoxyqueuosine reductase